MIRIFDPSPPSHWFLCFDPHVDTWWVRLLAFGRYKHVRAFGKSPAGVWLFHDLSAEGLALVAVPEGLAVESMITRWSAGCDVVHMPRGRARGLPKLPIYTCAVAVQHLIGWRFGALRPSALRRHCLANGGKIIEAQRAAAPASSPAAGARSSA